MQVEQMNSTTLSWDVAESLIGKKLMIEVGGKLKRTGYVIDIYNKDNPFIVLEVGFKLYEDRKLSRITSYEVI